MNSTPATRYSSAAMLVLIAIPRHALAGIAGSSPAMTTTYFEEINTWSSSLLFLLVHRQHALGDQEAAEDVDRGEHQRHEAESARPQRAVVVAGKRDADRQQRAHHDHRGDRIGHRHQRG